MIRKRNVFLYWISYAYLLISVPLMPALMGRTGWIAAIVGILYVLFALKKIPGISSRHIILATIGFMILAGLFIYKKPASALGRLLIWRNGITAFKNNLFTGAGWDNVAGELGAAQEEYFTFHAGSIYYFFAGDNSADSSDSRYWGFVPEEFIVGRVLLLWKRHGKYGLYLNFDKFS